MSTNRSRWRRLGVLVIVAGAVIIAGASPASANFEPENEPYTVDIQGTTGAAPDAYAGDNNSTIAITITNKSPTQKLGSANVTVPAPFTVAGGQVIELRNLNLVKNAVATVTITADVRTCVPASPAAFVVVAKKNPDYSGSSTFSPVAPSDTKVDVVGKCTLAFAPQPTNAKKGATITGVPFDPGGAAVKVAVIDAGNTGTATFFSSAVPIVLSAHNPNVANPMLSGTTSVKPTGGVASFAPKIGVSAVNYTLKATSTDFPSSSPTSTPFEIVDNQVTCAPTGPCDTSATSPSGRTATASFGSGGSTTNLTVSIGAGDAPAFECAGYPKGNSPASQFGFTGNGGDDRTGTFSITIPNASWFVILYQVCWASPVDFITKFGRMASSYADVGDGTPKPGTGEALNVGLLPNCKKWWWNDHWDWDDHWGFPNPSVETLPCISSRTFNWSTRAVTIEVKTTGHDPWAY